MEEMNNKGDGTLEDAFAEVTGGATKRRRVRRRTVLKVGVATAAGLALSSTYVKPGMASVGVQETYATSPGPGPDPDPDPDPDPEKPGRPSIEVEKTITSITGVGGASSTVAGTIKVRDASDKASTVVKVIHYKDTVEQRVPDLSGGMYWEVIGQFTDTGISGLLGSEIPDNGTLTVNYSLTTNGISDDAKSVRNTIELELQDREGRWFPARDSYVVNK